MRIVFTTKGDSWDSEMDPRFGRAPFFLVYDEEKDTLEATENSDITAMAHGAGPKAVEKLFTLNPDVLITGNGPGGNAAMVLGRTEIKVFIGAGSGTAKDALEMYKQGQLNEF